MEKVIHTDVVLPVISSQATQSTQPVSSGNQLLQPIIKKMPVNNVKKNLPLVAIAILVILAGIGTGWKLSGANAGSGSVVDSPKTGTGSKVTGANEAGVADESTFKDTAEGVLEEGGIDGEGTYHLVRDGGPSKNVYMSSTVIDLGQFKGKKVQVWGQTISGKKAGWLMDVGKIKVLE
ncbi:MAG: hypothetical protein AAB546_00785 [Patescibacteria group bacterium]